MTKDKKDSKEEMSNPALYSGLKFYDVLMAKQRYIAMCAYEDNLYRWHSGLADYYASTSSWITPSNKKLIGDSLVSISSKINNYIQFQHKLGTGRLILFVRLKTELLGLQLLIYEATQHLLLKTSSGDNGKFDVRHLFTT